MARKWAEKQENEALSPDIVCANAMFRASSSMNAMEKRALNIFISNVDVARYEPEIMEKRYMRLESIPVDSFIRAMGLDGGRRFDAMREIRDVCASIMERVVDISTPAQQKKGGFFFVHWMELCRVSEDGYYIEYRLGEFLKQWFVCLSRNFAVITLSNEQSFKKYASYRFYELFIAEYGLQGKEEESITLDFSFEELRRMFDMDDAAAKKNRKVVRYIKSNGTVDANGIRRFIIEPALDEINRYTGLVVSARYKVSGRRYTGVVFRICRKKKPALPDSLKKFLVLELMIAGVADSVAEAMADKYSPARIYFTLRYVRRMPSRDTVENMGAYIYRLIDEGIIDIGYWENPETRAAFDELQLRSGTVLTREMAGIPSETDNGGSFL